MVVLVRLDAGSAQDVSLCDAILRAAPRYMLETFGRPPTAVDAQRLLAGVPAGSSGGDTLVYAAFHGLLPIGLAQVSRGFVHAHRANIGLLLVKSEHCRQGHGSAIVRHLAEQSGRWPAITDFSVSVLENNAVGLAFWRRLGFATVGSGYVRPGCTGTLTVLQRAARPSLPAPVRAGPFPADAQRPAVRDR